MASTLARRLRQFRADLRVALHGPHMLAFLPATALAAFWIGGEASLMLVALLVPIAYVLIDAAPDGDPPDVARDTSATAISAALAQCGPTRTAVIFRVALDDFGLMVDRQGVQAAETVQAQIATRLQGALRQGDHVMTLQNGGFCVVMAPVRHMDLDSAIQVAGRMQSAVEDPVTLGAGPVFMSCSIGFCLSSRNPGNSADSWQEAAEAALTEARQNAPSAIRAHARGMQSERVSRSQMAAEAAAALENGQIRPWFQPQISTETGVVTGFESLARWIHPERGLISPAEFLPVLEEAGLTPRLGEVMLREALTALATWHAEGFAVPAVGVNFSAAELRDPSLPDRIRWELDQFDLEAEALMIEVLETVIATTPDDAVVRTINALARMGCRIDLDDFGTGHASLASIRRFAASRIKIDRSFVMKVDRDPDQQRMIAAILSMAERLGLDTLAEGVETVGEHAILAQLGCRHVQGFGIARPMSLEQTRDWMRAHRAKLAAAPEIRSARG